MDGVRVEIDATVTFTLLSNDKHIRFVARIETVLLQRNYHFPILYTVTRKNTGHALKRIFRSFICCRVTIILADTIIRLHGVLSYVKAKKKLIAEII